MRNIFRLSFISLATAILLNACRADEIPLISKTPDANSSAANTPMSIGQAILMAESNGTIPKLNHDDTIAGPDSDNNGIRDDIDAYIATLPYTEVQKKAIQQNSRALNSTLTVDKTDKTALKAIAFQIDRAIECLYDQFTSESNVASKLASDNEKMVINTKIRFLEYEKYNSQLSGEVFVDSSLSGAVCDN